MRIYPLNNSNNNKLSHSLKGTINNSNSSNNNSSSSTIRPNIKGMPTNS